jgi:hypothetical protein
MLRARLNLTTLTLALALPVAGCRSRTADLGMSDSAFVQILGELKVIADAVDTPPEVRAQRRDGVFRKYKTSAAQIEKLGPTLASHPQHAKRLWIAADQKANALMPRNK